MLLVYQLWYFIKEMPSFNACFDAAFLAVLQPFKHFLLEWILGCFLYLFFSILEPMHDLTYYYVYLVQKVDKPIVCNIITYIMHNYNN